MNMSELDYDLPRELIATHPAHPRDHSRLLRYGRADRSIRHHHFFELPSLLTPGDLLIVNNTRVLPAKLMLRKVTGAFIPGLFLAEHEPGQWQVLLRSRGKLRPGDRLILDGPRGAAADFGLTLLARGEEKGQWQAAVNPVLPAAELLARIGHVPLPPYIEQARRVRGALAEDARDALEYQTVYAEAGHAGSLAAPTAGLHFTPAVLDALQAMNIRTAPVTLQVGLGTFLPVETATLEAHRMHWESYVVPAATVAALRSQRAAGKRIVVVGTTACRTLEAAAGAIADTTQPPAELAGSTDLLISPGYPLQLTDALLTNFHLPRSTLLALVAALVGLESLHQIYAAAIAEKYRFYSYGDALLIE